MKPDWRDGEKFTCSTFGWVHSGCRAAKCCKRSCRWRRSSWLEVILLRAPENNPASYRVFHIPSRGVTKSGVLQFCCIIKMDIAQNKCQQASQGLVFLPRGTHGQESSCGQKFFLLYVWKFFVRGIICRGAGAQWECGKVKGWESFENKSYHNISAT